MDELSTSHQRRPHNSASQTDLKRYEAELWSLTQRILWERKHAIHPMNTARCTDFGTCEYMPLCLCEAGCEAIYEWREANEELKGANENGSVA